MNVEKPEIIDASKVESLKEEKSTTFVDAFTPQMKELYIVENPNLNNPDKEKEFDTDVFKDFVEQKEPEVVYFYYPWNKHLVKTVGKTDFIKLRTNRNQDLITSEEQKKLADYKVAVLGLSVGSNIAFVLTQAGISNTITMADFDELDTTNLNRILAGVHEVGLKKTTVASRRLYEANPFAEVNTFPDGITKENLENLLKNKEIDCIVEEIDDMPMKIATRRLAMKYKVPVVMITDNGDGAILHSERYDLGYDKILHTKSEYWDEIESQLQGDVPKELAGKIIIENIVGGPDKVDPLMMASVQRVLKKELVSWSQLGSAAILGGVALTYLVKQIALGKDNQEELRSYINPSDWIK